jgi:hypothetical protein
MYQNKKNKPINQNKIYETKYKYNRGNIRFSSSEPINVGGVTGDDFARSDGEVAK